jgi:hypothetical protein
MSKAEFTTVNADWYAAVTTEIAGYKDRIKELETDNKDYSDSFQIRWDADMRAIKMYQKAHPETNGAWPDHADMCVWLMEQLAAAQEAGE